MAQTHAGYIRDLFYEVREAAEEARSNKHAADGKLVPYEEGREAALIEILMMMQRKAEAFGLDSDELGMSSFDPLKDRLSPD